MSEAPALLKLLSAMERLEASDLFITEGKAPAARIHGVVRAMKTEATSRADLDELLGLALGKRGRAVFEATGDYDAGLSHEGRRFRLNISRQRGQIGVVARLVPPGDLSFQDLGLPGSVRRMGEAHRGLVMVTGATGSGKSTTLAALIHHINQTRRPTSSPSRTPSSSSTTTSSPG